MHTILERQLPLVYRVAATQVATAADAEDVAQDVFLEYVRRQPAFASDEHEKAWFIRTTLHRARNLHGSAWRRRTQSLELSPEPTAADDELGGAVQMALLSLPDEVRVILTLFYYENMDTAQIAATLQLGESAVRKRLQRGRDRLRSLLGGDAS